jgi:hypothetical protein
MIPLILLSVLQASAAHAAPVPFRPSVEEIEKYAAEPIDSADAPGRGRTYAVRLEVASDGAPSDKALAAAMKDGDCSAPRLAFAPRTERGRLTLAHAEAQEYLISIWGKTRAAEARRESFEKMSALANGWGKVKLAEASVAEQGNILERLARAQTAIKAKLARIDKSLADGGHASFAAPGEPGRFAARAATDFIPLPAASR